MLYFSKEPVASNLASLALRNDGCETVSGHGRIMLESSLHCGQSFHLSLEVQISWQVQHFVNFEVQISWQAQHFVNLHVQISWQVQHFVNLHVQISWQAQHFVNLHVQISWQVQQFVNLHVQISWQVQYKMRFREIADVRNAVFFKRTGGFEPGLSLALRNDGCETVSGHGRIMLESSLHCG